MLLPWMQIVVLGAPIRVAPHRRRGKQVDRCNDPEKLYYVGKASAPGVRTGQQVFKTRYSSVFLELAGYELQQINTLQVGRDSTNSEEYKAMRGREQQLYDYLLRGGQDLGNINRPVRPLNPRCRSYHRAANDAFGVLSPANCLL